MKRFAIALFIVFTFGACATPPGSAPAPADAVDETSSTTGSGEPPQGRFEVSGAVEGLHENPAVSSAVTKWGAAWAFTLVDEPAGFEVTFQDLPFALAPGKYPLAWPSKGIQEFGVAPDPQDLQPWAMLYVTKDTGAFDGLSGQVEDVTGTLIVESVANGAISGRFEFIEELSAGDPAITVRGSFLNVEMPVPAE